MEHFYILNGNHVAEYKKLMDQGFDACLHYFKLNIELINKHSERIDDEHYKQCCKKN